MVRILGFTAEYVEKITPNERMIYILLYRKEMEELKKQKELENRTR